MLRPRRLKDRPLYYISFLKLIRIADNWRWKAEIIEEVTRGSSDALGPPCFLFSPAPFIAAYHRRDHFTTFWLTPQLCVPQTSSKYRLFCLSQCDKPSSFNNCLFDISCSIKRFPNVTFPYTWAFYLSTIVRSVIMSSEEVEGGMKDVSLRFEGLIFQEWNFWQPLSSAQNVRNSLRLWFQR